MQIPQRYREAHSGNCAFWQPVLGRANTLVNFDEDFSPSIYINIITRN
ncbi:hypothetical protein [Salmonella phage vB_SenS_SB13]|uniref:Uncharacterized protein n=1 Tax=Salmonella phage vB_SenS_SB13 TaxID=2591135 RepID=A0A5J6TBC9_9CAUD|nr:hypothetical protein HWC37_gp190 [Salmonella phage vB_SenS_SB13]QFG07644.1 hypothetical protein [Salmonella phage vB_SenS_SB13]